MRRLWLLPLCAALAGCPPKVDTGADGGGLIDVGPSGGIFVREGAVINIPSGAVNSDTIIFVTVVDTGVPDVPGRTRISLGYRFTPSSLQFQKEVSVTLPYLPERLPAQGIDPNTYDMRRNSSLGAYDILTGASTNPTDVCVIVGSGCHVVRANTDHLGMFWITSPQGPAVSTLALSPQSAFLSVGQTQQFTVTVTDPTGHTIANPTVSWSIVPPRAASVDGTGLVKALAPGTATLTAQVSQQTATAPVYIQGSTKGPLAFAHDNPFPTGNDLYGGALAGGGAFFVGGNGTVLGLSPSGAWTHAFSLPLVTFHAISGTPTDAIAAGTGVDTNGQAAGVVVELAAGTQPTVTAFPTAFPLSAWFDGTYGMAVGTGNDVIVRKNGTWTNICPRANLPQATCYSPSFETLLSVVGDGAGGFVTVGNRGSIYRFDPSTNTWNSLYQSQLAVRFDGAFLLDGTGAEAWGVGGNKIWHFTSGAWTPLNLPSSPVLTATTAIGPVAGQIAVGGTAGTQGYLLLYGPLGSPDGGAPDAGQASWSVAGLRGPQVIRGVFGDGAGGYAVGDFGAVWQYQGGGFVERSHGFYGDVTDVAVVGTTPIATVNECAWGDAGCTAKVGSVMIRQDAGVWVPLGGAQPFLGPLFSVAAASLSDVTVTGVAQGFHYDGASWLPLVIQGGSPGPIFDLENCGGTLEAVGAFGVTYSGQAGGLLAHGALTSTDLFSVQCPSALDVWMAGDYVLFENGAPVSSPSVNPAPWRSVWSPGPGEAFAFGQSPYGIYWDTANMNVIQAPGGLPPDNLPAMWGSTIDNLYLVGSIVTPVSSGYGVRFDGAQWTLIDIGAHRKATAVSGSSALEVWVGTQGGGLLHGNPPP